VATQSCGRESQLHRVHDSGQRRAVEQSEPSALRIDTDVFAALSETTTDDGDDAPVIARWFDCWGR
jgi:hypothetical protein